MKPFVLFSIISLCALTVSAGPASANDIKSKNSKASGAEYKGKVALEDLKLERSKYLGCVVRVRFELASMPPVWMGRSSFFACDKATSIVIGYDENDQDAKEWVIDGNRRGRGSFSLYVLVDDHELIALGKRRKKNENGRSYSW